MRRLRPQFLITACLVLLFSMHCKRDELPPGSALKQQSLKPEAYEVIDDHSRLTLYEIDIEIDLDFKTFGGTEKIRYTNTESVPLQEIYLHIYPNSDAIIADPEENNVIVENVRVNDNVVQYSNESSILEIKLSSSLKPGQKVEILLDFKGQIPRINRPTDAILSQTLKQLIDILGAGGKASGNYGIYSYGNHIFSLGLWYPIVSAHDTRGWDIAKASGIGDVSYYDVSNYLVRITGPQNAVVVTTGVKTGSTTRNGLTTTNYEAEAVRDFAIQISEDYSSLSDQVENVRVNSYFLATDSLAGRKALRYAIQALQVFEQMIGPYPYTELDVVEAPLIGGAAGVEFPGLVTISDMFYNPPQNSESEPYAQLFQDNPILKQTFEFVVAHEVAHQWWNAVVGSDSKSHPFLDEAMANYSAVLYFERTYGKEAAEQQLFLQMKLNYQLHRLMGGRDAIVDQSTKDFDNTIEYAAIVYGKGGLFFHALREVMSDKEFFELLRQYYAKYKFKIATPDNLIDLAKQVSTQEKQINYIVNRWLRGRYGDEDIGKMSVAKLLSIFVFDGMKTTPEMELFRDLMRIFERLENF